MITDTGTPQDLDGQLRRWVAAGLISAEQAERIAASETARLPAPRPGEPTAPRGPSLVVEALGYLGGVLILAAGALLVGQLWQDLSALTRLALLVVVAAVLVGAGLAVPPRLGPAGTRLRTVLWSLSVLASAGALGVLGSDVLDWREEDVALLAFGGASAIAAALWWVTRTGLLQAALLVTLGGVTASVAFRVTDDESVAGLAVWLLGAAWLGLGTAGVLHPRRTAQVLGAVAALFGVQVTTDTTWGLALALATVAALIALAMLLGDLVLLAVGAVGALRVVPQVVGEWFPGELAAPLVLLVVGVMLVGAAVRIARRREKTPG